MKALMQYPKIIQIWEDGSIFLLDRLSSIMNLKYIIPPQKVGPRTKPAQIYNSHISISNSSIKKSYSESIASSSFYSILYAPMTYPTLFIGNDKMINIPINLQATANLKPQQHVWFTFDLYLFKWRIWSAALVALIVA